MKYAICVILHKDTQEILPTLNSILSQSSKDWKLFFIGDQYPVVRFSSIVSNIISATKLPPERFFYVNLGKREDSQADVYALNFALEQARKEGHEIFCNITLGDIWHVEHLSIHSWGYDNFLEAVVVCTRAKTPQGLSPLKDISLCYNTKFIENSKELIRSASWKLNLMPLDYFADTHESVEALMQKRINGYCQECGHKMLYIPKTSFTIGESKL